MGILAGAEAVNAQNAAAECAEIRLGNFAGNPKMTIRNRKITFYISNLAGD
jgi:hypothetical protein